MYIDTTERRKNQVLRFFGEVLSHSGHGFYFKDVYRMYRIWCLDNRVVPVNKFRVIALLESEGWKRHETRRDRLRFQFGRIIALVLKDRKLPTRERYFELLGEIKYEEKLKEKEELLAERERRWEEAGPRVKRRWKNPPEVIAQRLETRRLNEQNPEKIREKLILQRTQPKKKSLYMRRLLGEE